MDADRYRAAEDRLWASVGADRTEREVKLAASGATVRVLESGDPEGPPIVFVHGGAVGATSWAGLVGELQPFRCIAFDRPGCGLSPVLPTPIETVDEFIAFSQTLVADILDALGLDEAFLVGTSLGGFIATHATAATPERIRRTVLIGSVFGSDLDRIPLVMRIGTVGPIGRLMARMPPSKAAAKMMLRQIGLKDAMAAGRVTDEMVEWFLSNMRDTDAILNEAISNPDLMDISGMRPDAVIPHETLHSIETPVLLIWGENDPMGSADVGRRFTEAIPNAQLDLWPGVGHAPWLDHPDRARDAIEAFFA